MQFNRTVFHRKFGVLIILMGLVAVALAILIATNFATKYLMSEYHLTIVGINKPTILRDITSIVGILLIISGALLMIIEEKKYQRIIAFINSYNIAVASLVGAWVILYSIYLMKHNIPVNPGGFYLESARQLAQNHYLIPAYVKGFGLTGIPFAYPPLPFYFLAVMGNLLGGILKTALYVPGVLLLIQAILMYIFMHKWTGSKYASLWAGMILLLIPQIFLRTLFADGITTGLSGIFLLLSWIIVIGPKVKVNIYRKSIIGGIFVGLSILSHPGIGLFCSVSFVIWYIYQNGWNYKTIKGLFSTGITAFLVIMPWLWAVISMHGIPPFVAGLKDPKSSLSVFGNIGNISLQSIQGYIESIWSYIYSKHVGDFASGASFIVFPFLLALIINIIKGPRIFILLLLASVITFQGHPSVTMFILAASLGLFVDNYLMPNLIKINPKTAEQATDEFTKIGNWQFLGFFAVNLALLFILCLPYTRDSSFSSGEQKTYNWIRTNTEKNSTFLVEGPGNDEKLVYFGQRTILLPLLGAEWVPSPDPQYSNGKIRNGYINNEIYKCRKIECLQSLFKKYNLAPDYMIYQISDNGERTWVKMLSASPLFSVAFESGDFVTLHVPVSALSFSTVKP